MVFASPIFLFLFLPLFLALYYAVPFRFRSTVIFVGSSVFYAWWRLDFLLVLYGIILWSWGIALLIEKYQNEKKGKWALRIGVTGNLLTLGYFKYWNFGVANFHAVLLAFGIESPSGIVEIFLPIGISFVVFHAISYLVDVWRKDVPATRRLIDFSAFFMLFPHVVAGPVLRYKDLAAQFLYRQHNMTLFGEGAYRFMAGFAQKVLIADMVAPLADKAFALNSPSLGDA